MATNFLSRHPSMQRFWQIFENAFGHHRTIEPNVKSGEKLKILQSVKTHAVTSWYAPFTGSCEVVVPAGTVVKVMHDSVRSAAGFTCVPINYDEFGLLHVPEHASNVESYAGYYLVLLKSQIGSEIELCLVCE